MSRTTKPQPPVHGVIKVSTLKIERAKAHLAQMTQGAADVRYYGGHGARFSSGGALSPGGASGSDYQTTSADSIGDADSQGPTGY